MKKLITLGIFLLAASPGLWASVATCIAVADSCLNVISLPYNPDAGEICIVDEIGDSASLHVYDANGNLIQSLRARCPRQVDPC